MTRRLTLMVMAVLAAMTMTAATESNYTVVVSLDGFRWDYAEVYDTPFFDQLAQQGVKAVMMPSFPSKTFPNHYTLATGLYPDHHGIVANSFLDRTTGEVYSLGDNKSRSNPKYYGGEPIWLTAKRQGVTTATVYWVGSDVAINGDHANYWHDYLKKPLLTFSERKDEVVRLLSLPADKRPHLVMCYFEEPDHSGHSFGPQSKPTRKSVESLDSLLQVMWTAIRQLPIGDKVNLIITGDHGMTWTDGSRTVPVMKHLKQEWISRVEGNLPGLIYVSKPEYADSVVVALQGVDHIRAWKRADVPAYLHYGSNARIGDVVVLPDVGWFYTDFPVRAGGSHGYDNTASDMLVGFRAIGPDFKAGYSKPDKFRNVDVYPLVAHLLGVIPAPCDGNINEVHDMLR